VLRYLIRRLMWAFVLFVAVTVVTYIIFYAIPADPARLACGQRATAECIKRAAHYLGTDRPLYVPVRQVLRSPDAVQPARHPAPEGAEPRPLLHGTA